MQDKVTKLLLFVRNKDSEIITNISWDFLQDLLTNNLAWNSLMKMWYGWD